MRRKELLPISLLLIFLSLTEMHGQQAVLSSGGNASGTGGTVSFSVGQVAYTAINGASGSVILGVQQPYNVTVVGTDDPSIFFSATIYPNPANSFFQLKLESDNMINGSEILSAGLYDLNGKQLFLTEITENITLIPIENLTDAMYFLRIVRNHTEIKTFKIFKTN